MCSGLIGNGGIGWLRDMLLPEESILQPKIKSETKKPDLLLFICVGAGECNQSIDQSIDPKHEERKESSSGGEKIDSFVP